MRDWERANFLEDGEDWVDPVTSAKEISRYGHRDRPGVAIDRYLPTQKGHAYEMFDVTGRSDRSGSLRPTFAPRGSFPPSDRLLSRARLGARRALRLLRPLVGTCQELPLR